MEQRVTAMIHVPDVRAAVNWYEAIGFRVLDTGEVEAEMVWALLSFGEGRIMFDEGGQPGAQARREVDLYIHTANVDDLFQRLKDRVAIQEEPHDTFYGMREFIVRDLNGFWITFGEPSRAA